MAALRHPNCVGFLGVVAFPPCVVSEYCVRGALSDVLREARRSEAKAKRLDMARRLMMVGGAGCVLGAGLGGWGECAARWASRGGV